jgi:FlaA1/EpsC-like NDP-sugar epimerase
MGIREGEKLHEVMVTSDDSRLAYEYDKHYIIYPDYKWKNKDDILEGGHKVSAGFEYNSGTNAEWLTVEQLQAALKEM